jgi:hypothetical protein
MQQSDLTGFNWFLGSAWEPISRGSASLARGGRLEAEPPDLCSLARGGKLEAEPPDLCYQAEPGNEENLL